MSGKRKQASRYATQEDFHEVFMAHMDALYQLALMLTVDPAKAEQVFVAGVEDCVHSNRVFMEWAHSWAKRMVIENAIRLIDPHPAHADLLSASIATEKDEAEPNLPEIRFDLVGVLSLEPFERFVFILTVLQDYSDQECALLLDCLALEVRHARESALEKLAKVDSAGEVVGSKPDESLQHMV